ncbi:hypothetical protein E8E14_003075 [Neopestalotiopsis sp. 37M]|nr:hypothetical protein E8E14_003075 [Neopestalotiopsis sp. 37M]
MESTQAAKMEVSKEDLVMELARSIVKEYNLDVLGMLKLADALDEIEIKNTVPPVTFPELVKILSDVDSEIPDWVTVSNNRLNEYTPPQFRIIIKLIEARFWLGATEHHLNLLAIWDIAFGFPRSVHRQMMSKKDFEMIGTLKGTQATQYSFAKAMIPRFYEDMPDCYKSLRQTYFPDGIDDAFPAFRKYQLEARAAVIKLQKRIKLLKEAKAITDDCTLLVKSQRAMFETTKAIVKTTNLANRWEQKTKAQKEYFQLPGVDLGLPYGHEVYTDYDVPRAYVLAGDLQNDGPNYWFPVDAIYTPIRWRPGTPWIDFLRNVRQDHPAFRVMYDLKSKADEPGEHHDVDRESSDEESSDEESSDEDEDEDIDEGEDVNEEARKKYKGPPIELRIPSSVAAAFNYYATMYQFYDSQYNENDPNALSRPKTYTKKEAKAVAKRLSEGTGEPWWKVTKFDDIQESTIQTRLPNHLELTNGRPRFDALGNLRFDYMGAVLLELKTNRPVWHFREEQDMAVSRRGCDDDTPLGQDLQGSVDPQIQG